jgi:hypothetical protein
MTHVRTPDPSVEHGRHSGRGRRRWWILGLVAVVVAALIVTAIVVVPGLIAASDPGSTSAPGHVVPEPISTGPTPGAATVGSAAYPLPTDALYVSPSGNNSSSGSLEQPFLTVQHAITTAHAGQTIVLRAGVYHERVTVLKGKPVVVQPYPNEAVWFDGSTVVAGWHRDGKSWVSGGWTVKFDSSPTFDKGAPDSSVPDFNFINPQHPLAAHPDQVWIGGKELTQVATAAEVKTGTFAVDYASSKLYIGSDPSGKEVRASDKTKAFAIQAAGSTLRGVGIRRYATSVPGFGAVTVEAPGVTVQDVTIEQDATTGLFVGAANCVVRNVTLRDNGMLGMNANYADNLLVSAVRSTHNNLQRFNSAPVSGGFKITRTRGISISNSNFSHNFGPGLWFDQSDYDASVVSNSMNDNASHGMSMEISAKFVVAGNVILNNGGNGIKLNDSNDIQIWNNTVANNSIDLRVAQDTRRGSDMSVPGHDPRQKQPDPTMPWVISKVTVSNNVFSGATNTAVVTVQDYSGEFTAEQLGVRLNGNAYQLPSLSTRTPIMLWERGHNNAAIFHTLKDFVRSTGQEKKGVQLPFAAASQRTWLTSKATSAAESSGKPTLPGAILALLGWDASDHRVGAQ